MFIRHRQLLEALANLSALAREGVPHFVLRTDESLKEFERKAEYMRMNPVRRNLVWRPEDYRWLWVDASFV